MIELLRSLPDAVALESADGRLLEWNSAFAALAAFPEDGLEGAALAAVLSNAPPLLDSVTETPRGRLHLYRELGRWLGPASPRAGRAAVDGRLGAAWTAGTVGEALGGDSLEPVARLLVRLGAESVPGSDCLLAVVPTDNLGVFEVVSGEGPWAAVRVGARFRRRGSLAGRAMEEGRVLESAAAGAESALRAVLEEGGIQTCRIVPFLAASPLPDGRRALGMIGFYRRGQGGFGRGERQVIDGFARLAGLAVQTLLYAAAARQERSRLTAVLDVAVDLAGSLRGGEVVSRLVRRAAKAVGAERCVLLRVAGAETVVEDAYDAIGLPDEIGLRSPIDRQPLMEEGIRTREAVRGGRYDLAPLPEVLRESLRDVRHTLTLPLVVGGDVLAVLVLSRRQERRFSDGDVATLRLIGSVAVLALRNAWLFSEAEAASRAKSEFLNMAAHELRTPLTVVSGYLSMLSEGSFGPPPPGWERALAALTAKTSELGRLVEDILLAARLETGRVTSSREAFDVGRELRAAVRRAAPAARRLGGELRTARGGDEVLVRADRELLGQVLDNLIANALAYHRGKPWVEVRVRRVRGRVRVEVEDRGRGVSPEEQARIFEKFHRVADRRLGSPPGTGLGLHLSRELAARMGGELKLEWSRPGEGSRFVLTLRPARVGRPAAGSRTAKESR